MTAHFPLFFLQDLSDQAELSAARQYNHLMVEVQQLSRTVDEVLAMNAQTDETGDDLVLATDP